MAFVLYSWCCWTIYIESLFQSCQYISTPQLVFRLLLLPSHFSSLWWLAVSVSSSLMFSVIAWLGSLSSVPTLWFSVFISKLKYWPHRSLISSSFVKTSPVALLTLRIWHMSLPDRSLASAIRYISCCPSKVSSWSYSPSIASAFTLATTLFAFPFAVLNSTLSFSSPVLFQIFSLSFFFLTALSVSSFHHQHPSPVFFLSSHHCSTFYVVASSMFDSLSTRFLRNFSFVSSSLSFHHLNRFLPAALLCLVFFTTRSAISILCCVVIASEGSTLQFLHSLACSFLNMI